MSLPAERSRVFVTLGSAASISRGADGLLSSGADIFYLQPNNGLLPREPSSLVIRRWVEFPRPGPLPAIPIETVDAPTLALYPDGPPILAGEQIPMSAGWISPVKGLFLAVLGLVIGGVALGAAAERA